MNKNKNLILFLIGIFIFVIVLFPIIVLTPSEIGIFPTNTAESIVGYAGAIFGGALTLIGVWWTIISQNKKRIEDQELRDRERKEALAIQYKPILFIDDVVIQNPKNEIYSVLISVNLKNIGRGEAKNISIRGVIRHPNNLCHKTAISFKEEHYQMLSDKNFLKIDFCAYENNETSKTIERNKRQYNFIDQYSRPKLNEYIIEFKVNYENPFNDEKYVYSTYFYLIFMKNKEYPNAPNWQILKDKEKYKSI